MSAPVRKVDPTTEAAQLAASDPERSAWVSANAGSGKTHVLTQRVVRLLLAGADPGRLLCLTFTKAAAAEMANRVFERLGNWAWIDREELTSELQSLLGRAPTREELTRSRRLFARALETPGGLKIQTVHAFCERLLHQFPFEAGVSGHFEVLEENAANVLIGEARREMLAVAAADLAGPLGQALRTVVLASSDRGYEDAIAELIEDRARFEGWLAANGSLDACLADLAEALGVADARSPESVEAEILSGMPFDDVSLRRLCDLLAAGGKNDTKAAARLAPYFEARDERGRLAAYLDLFTTSSMTIRKANSLITNRVRNAWDEIDEIITRECKRLSGLFDTIAAAECYAVSASVLRLADSVLSAYRRKKSVRGFLDFDDLIARTVDLLHRSGASQWVHYKVERGIDHILLDEAQDTSPGQWRVITALAEEFFAGEGAARGTRTLFAVGDEKQSIYSFQGAVPAWFSRVKREIAARAAGAGQGFSDVELKVSFRSTPDIIAAIDEVFRPELAHRGLASETKPPVHEAIRRGEPGEVIVWPMEPVPDADEPGDWAEPLDHLGQSAPEMVLATRIARTVKSWLAPGEASRLASGKRIRPGEILVLTRKRGPLTDAINRCLKAAGVPVAGADRLWLADHIAVKDLVALGDVVLQENDDLSLAAVLKSPLFGMSEDALYAIAHDRHGRWLWQALKEASDAEPFQSAYATLERMRSDAGAVTPFAFYADVLGPRGGRRRFAERLGAEAEDVIDEFLAQALAFERLETPSLQGFLEWMRFTATEIRRESDSTQDAVRVMTVHGAKGLEADIVFLVDDGSAPAHAGHDANFLAMTDDPEAAEPAPLVWARGSRKRPEIVRTLGERERDKAKEEYRRLLYVGATRARDRLVVCGTLKDNATDPNGGWHALVTAALAPTATESTAIDGAAELIWRKEASAPAAAREDDERSQAAPIETPRWLHRAVTPARLVRTVTPSRLAQPGAPDETVPASAPTARGGRELRRGQLLHRLLEALPERPEAERSAAAERFIEAVGGDFPADERRQMIEEVMAVLADPEFAAVFAAGSRGEVEIAADLESAAGTVRLSGRIDRLAVTDHEVLIVDYKTDRPAPETAADIRQSYVAQLALYAKAIAPLYPNRSIRAALLWTEVPALMAVPAARLEEAGARVLAGPPRSDGQPPDPDLPAA